eukprot:evm.model.scf_4695.1 EVM.evm.TU.scf_4695.1   scf_4695:1485-3281(+)
MPEWFVGSHEAVVCEEGRAGATEVSVPAGDCQLHKDPGTCEMHHLRYYFNNLRGRCEAFIWGGCGGNNNNFESVAECEEKCPAPSGSAVDSDGTQMPRRFGHQCGSKVGKTEPCIALYCLSRGRMTRAKYAAQGPG